MLAGRVTCTRRLEFDAAHRVVGHEGKCAHLHGHRYAVELTAEAEMDAVGRVIDFSVLKAKVGGFIDGGWDHGMLLNPDDHAARAAVAAFDLKRYDEEQQRARLGVGGLAPLELDLHPGWTQRVYYMPPDLGNPTAENIARHLLRDVCSAVLAGTGVYVVKVVVYETPNCWAEATWPRRDQMVRQGLGGGGA